MINQRLAHDALGRYTTAYDQLDRVAAPNTPASQPITYAYEPRGYRATMDVAEARRYTYLYDPAGRID
jgi:hypothetical protein